MNANEIEADIIRLTQSISQSPHDDDLYRQRADLHWKRQDWKSAIDDYTEAIRLNPASPAVQLREMVMQIIAFYNKDIYNP